MVATSSFAGRRHRAMVTSVGLVLLTGAVASACGSPTHTQPPPSMSATPIPSIAKPSATLPSPKPTATLSPGQSWGGLIWSEPMESVTPWAHGADQVVEWHGHFVGLGVVGSSPTGKVVVAGSADLVRWTELAGGAAAPFPGGPVGRLVAGPEQLIAIGLGNGDYGPCRSDGLVKNWDHCLVTGVWQSPDGATWSKVDSRVFGNTRLADVAAGPAGVVAVGNLGNVPVIWKATSGADWESVPLPSDDFKNARLSGVSAIPGGFLVSGSVSEEAAGWWSGDGATWQRVSVQQPDPVGIDLGLVCSTSHGLFAAGFQSSQPEIGAAAGWISTDGRSWTPEPVDNGSNGWPTGESNSEVLSIWSGGGHVLVVGLTWNADGSGGTTYGQSQAGWDSIVESVDGVHWHNLVMRSSVSTAAPALGDKAQLIVRSNGVLAYWTSPDGEHVYVMRATATP